MTDVLRTLLRGISQIFFLRSSPAGLLVLVAVALGHPGAAALMALGCAVQSLGAWAAGLREPVRDGLMGYNGALVGAAAPLVTHGVDATALAIGTTAAGALACVPAHLLLERLFASRPLHRFGLPVVTAPFCLVAGLLYGALQPLIGAAPLTSSPESVSGTVLGIVNAFAEVVLADGLLPGLVILAGLFAGAASAGLWGLFGAAVALGIGLAITGDMAAMSTGLNGYSAVLVAIAVGSVFSPGRGIAQRLLWALLGVAAAVVLRWALEPLPVLTYTWPFVLSLWAVLIGRGMLARGSEPPAKEPRALGADQI